MNHPYSDFLHLVEKPARYTGGEYGSAKRKGDEKARIALAFPDTYEIGMCFLGFHILYHVLKNEPEIGVERVYAPWRDLEAQLRERSLPLVSLESATPLAAFDAVGFTLQHELSFTNILAMLELGGISLKSGERKESEPLVIGGGPVALQCEPAAPFFDLFVLGDGEEALPLIMHRIAAGKEQKMPRRRMLEDLGGIQGVYVPSLADVSPDPGTGMLVPAGDTLIKRTEPVDLKKYPYPADPPIPDTEVIFDRYSVEIARGCNGGCRFCQGGFIYRPLRLRTCEDIVNTIRSGIRCTGFDEVSLTSLSTADYPAIEDLVAFLTEEVTGRDVELSLSSLRAYDLPEKLFCSLQKIRQSTLTIALEAGSQRLRNLINKNVTEENIVKTAEKVFSRGWKRIKLYFMIGLPTETDEDLEGIINATCKVYDVARTYSRRAAQAVTASVSTFVPKAHTPFQWESMISKKEIERRQRFLYRLSRKHRLSIKWHDARMSEIEGIMARGDRALADVILHAYRLGCRFDSWGDQIDYEAWLRAFAETGIRKERYLEAFALDAPLPWRHLDSGVTETFLRKEREKAYREAVTEPCFFNNRCYGCGVNCDLSTADKIAGSLPAAAAVKAEKTDVFSLRITFRRTGRMRYLSQLDIVRTMPRVLRRGGLKLESSKGFHRKPVVSFSPALPLGASSLRDLFDIKIVAASVPGGELVEQLNEAAPEGLDFLRVRPLRKWEKKLSRRIRAVDCAFDLSGNSELDTIEQSVERFIKADAVPLEYTNKKGKTRHVDLRSWVYEARILDALKAEKGPSGPVLFLRIQTETRPLAILEHLTEGDVDPTRLYRVDLLDRGALGFTQVM